MDSADERYKFLIKKFVAQEIEVQGRLGTIQYLLNYIEMTAEEIEQFGFTEKEIEAAINDD